MPNEHRLLVVVVDHTCLGSWDPTDVLAPHLEWVEQTRGHIVLVDVGARDMADPFHAEGSDLGPHGRADVLRALTRPAGLATPLADGLRLAQSHLARRPDMRARLVVVSDGRANVPLDATTVGARDGMTDLLSVAADIALGREVESTVVIPPGTVRPDLPAALSAALNAGTDGGAAVAPREALWTSSRDAELTPAVRMPPVAVVPLEPGPTATAVLRVYRHGHDADEYFKVAGEFPGLPLPDTVSTRQGRPRLSLADLATSDGEQPRRIRDRMRAWSHGQNELVSWLNAIRLRHDEPSLVIMDDTNWEIPWELLWLDATDDPDRVAGLVPPEQGWLGALMTTTRRLALRRRPVVPPSHGNGGDDTTGTIVAFVDPAMTADDRILSRYGARSTGDVEDLIEWLAVHDDRIALVYLAGHGRIDRRSGNAFRIADISLFDLEGCDLTAVRRSASVVVLNACYSALSIEDALNNDGIARGFAHVFLGAGSKALVGTTGPVGDDYAREFASELFRRLEDPGGAVAVALRDCRRGLAERERALPHRELSSPEGTRILLRFLFGFMYVCYGEPHAALLLPTPQTTAP